MTDKPKEPISWRDLASKSVELGLGAVFLTKQAAERLLHEVEEKGQVTKEEGKEMLANLLEQGKAGREHVEQMVNSAVEKIIAKAELAKCSEVEALKERIARLEDQLRHSSQS